MSLRRRDLGLLIFRLNFGVFMLFHGIYKLLHGVEAIKGMLAELGIVSVVSYAVHLGETIAPILLIIGFRVRLAAMVFTAVMVVAFLMAHTTDFFTLGAGGAWAHELVALYLFGGLGLVFTGGGRYGVSSNNRWD